MYITKINYSRLLLKTSVIYCYNHMKQRAVNWGRFNVTSVGMHLCRYVCLPPRFRRFSHTVGLLQPCTLVKFLSHIYDTLRLVTLAAAYLNMSDQTLISNEANTKQNWRNISRNILFIQRGAERGSEGWPF